ncbi:MAG: ECF transporter S component [Fusicatenibacter sp.]|nr:ECF transporter S component [Lachnospiraceae bacterium]MDY2937596.1 ECF transporter S component [Fusicatenibacter sp.]
MNAESTTTKQAKRQTSALGKTRYMVQIAMLAAISTVLMLFDIPLPFAPSFYQLDLSEVPVLIGAFAMGPLAGAMIELVKVLIHLVIAGTTTAGVGEFANFLIGCSFVIPAAWIYRYHKTKKNALIGMTVGTICMAAVGGFLNAFVLLPAYAKAFGMPMEALVEMGSAVNKAITSLPTFCLFAVVPFNLIKGVVVSMITLLLYKHISRLLKGEAMG